jgi:hypothetical protein
MDAKTKILLDQADQLIDECKESDRRRVKVNQRCVGVIHKDYQNPPLPRQQFMNTAMSALPPKADIAETIFFGHGHEHRSRVRLRSAATGHRARVL